MNYLRPEQLLARQHWLASIKIYCALFPPFASINLSAQRAHGDVFDGEVDESYFGGKRKSKRGSYDVIDVSGFTPLPHQPQQIYTNGIENF